MCFCAFALLYMLSCKNCLKNWPRFHVCYINFTEDAVHWSSLMVKSLGLFKIFSKVEVDFAAINRVQILATHNTEIKKNKNICNTESSLALLELTFTSKEKERRLLRITPQGSPAESSFIIGSIYRVYTAFISLGFMSCS